MAAETRKEQKRREDALILVRAAQCFGGGIGYRLEQMARRRHPQAARAEIDRLWRIKNEPREEEGGFCS